MAQFIHPYIVPVYDFGSDEDGVYLVMGLMAGGSLKDRMGTVISVQDAAKVIIPVANALGYVHSHNTFTAMSNRITFFSMNMMCR